MPTVVAYSDPNYSGASYILDAGRHEMANIRIRSIRIPLGWGVTLFTGPNLTGDELTLRRDDLEIAAFTAASIEVRAYAVFYRITPAHSNKALDVAQSAQENRAHVVQYTHHGGDNQCFLPIQDDGEFYTICAKHSGKVLDVALNPTPELVGHIIQYAHHGRDNQRFRIRNGNEVFRVEAKHSGKVWDVANASTSNSAHLIEYDWRSQDNQRFAFELTEARALPVRQGRQANDIGDVPRMTDFVPPPAEGPLSLIGELWIPYWLVSDGDRSDRVKVAESPYYKVSRYGHWKLLYYYDFDGGVDQDRTFTYETGLTVTHTHQEETTKTWTIGAKLALKLPEQLTSELAGSFVRTTKTTITDQVVAATKTVKSVQQHYAAGPRMAEASWARADLLVISRMNGSEVRRWQLVDDENAIIDRWP